MNRRFACVVLASTLFIFGCTLGSGQRVHSDSTAGEPDAGFACVIDWDDVDTSGNSVLIWTHRPISGNFFECTFQIAQCSFSIVQQYKEQFPSVPVVDWQVTVDHEHQEIEKIIITHASFDEAFATDRRHS